MQCHLDGFPSVMGWSQEQQYTHHAGLHMVDVKCLPLLLSRGRLRNNMRLDANLLAHSRGYMDRDLCHR
jgi:hypothetical protein